ncbi:MAG: EAL domain-containing response regulator [Kangiellaceae bacterium]|jgi:EAL domain-containing protein (putative c-di-GMP-specific phosphodiesterase class I)/CheY-like chemotaxis protein|nr:EAL domain-containing response regulator [Kangiellaceae bacterium]
MQRLFIIDDDEQICDMLAIATESLFSHIETINDARKMLSIDFSSEDIILLDLMMPEMDGVEVLRSLAKNKVTSHIFLMSGYDSGVLHSSEELGIDYGLKIAGNFTKPIGLRELQNKLRKLIRRAPTSNKPEVTLDIERFIPTAHDLSTAIEQDQLVLFYQPQKLVSEDSVISCEALVRWHHPDHGLIFPGDFIELAEQTGLIDKLTESVISIAVKQLIEWQTHNIPVRISINISPQNIVSLNFPEQLKERLDSHKIDPSMLILEVTETALMSELTQSLDILTRLRLKGFKLSIDDFGTGFSSLSQLHKIPFTELKIDRSFVNKMAFDEESKAIVETCIMLGHKLKMTVVAEGVEDNKTYDLLQQLGCDIAQGFYIARPLPVDEFEHWYRLSKQSHH